ncbi:PREDICTED: uncharacterized protein LOC108973168 [Bactrocera latifrons]|uniref:uncharacterized protein LOC108973168 n=1 Tax=Bactrocera latifrons TaxID=174628 RepID=UPI0008DC70B8|nr:PREDICTED: uncharacterized protein LOC108973168 [Bactrocera latifrons]
MSCNTDYRCQDDVFKAATNGRLGSASILSSSLESQPYFNPLGQQTQHQNQAVRNSVQLSQKSICMSNGLFDCNEGVFNCDERNENIKIDSGGETLATTVSSGHMMYTVHRVVTTSQIQTALGNTYASSSSVSSVVSALRNDNLVSPTSISTSLTTIPGNGIAGISGNVLSKMDDNSNTANNVIISGSGISDPHPSEGTENNSYCIIFD